MEKRKIFEKGILALKPFLFSFQEGLYDRFFKTELGQKLFQANKDAKRIPGIVVGMIGSVLSVMEKRGVLTDFIRDVGTDSAALIMHRLQKEGLPSKQAEQMKAFLSLNPEEIRPLLEWAQTVDGKQREFLFSILGELSEEQLVKLLSMEPDIRQHFWDAVQSPKSEKTTQILSEVQEKIEKFFQDAHVEADKLQQSLQKKIAEERKKRKKK